MDNGRVCALTSTAWAYCSSLSSILDVRRRGCVFLKLLLSQTKQQEIKTRDSESASHTIDCSLKFKINNSNVSTLNFIFMILSFMYLLLLIIRVTAGHSLHGQLFQLFWATPRYSQAIGEI